MSQSQRCFTGCWIDRIIVWFGRLLSLGLSHCVVWHLRWPKNDRKMYVSYYNWFFQDANKSVGCLTELALGIQWLELIQRKIKFQIWVLNFTTKKLRWLHSLDSACQLSKPTYGFVRVLKNPTVVQCAGLLRRYPASLCLTVVHAANATGTNLCSPLHALHMHIAQQCLPSCLRQIWKVRSCHSHVNVSHMVGWHMKLKIIFDYMKGHTIKAEADRELLYFILFHRTEDWGPMSPKNCWTKYRNLR